MKRMRILAVAANAHPGKKRNDTAIVSIPQGPDLEIFHLITRTRCQSYLSNQICASFILEKPLDLVPVCPSLSEKPGCLQLGF